MSRLKIRAVMYRPTLVIEKLRCKNLYDVSSCVRTSMSIVLTYLSWNLVEIVFIQNKIFCKHKVPTPLEKFTWGVSTNTKKIPL